MPEHSERPSDSELNRFELVVEYDDPEDRRTPWLVPVIDGVDLRDPVRALEEEAGAGKLAGRYGGITVHRNGPPLANHYLARRGELFEHGRLAVLGCSCGIVDCWPLLARIEVREEWVVWRDFRHGFRDWSYDRLGPFRFERGEYEAEVDRIDRWRGVWP